MGLELDFFSFTMPMSSNKLEVSLSLGSVKMTTSWFGTPTLEFSALL